LEEKRVDGLVLCSSRLDSATIRLVTESHPAVTLVNRCVEGLGSDVGIVRVDDVVGGLLATAHLIARGHRAIGFLTGPPGSHSGQLRLQGYHEALLDAGLRYDERLLAGCAPVAEGGRAAALALLDRAPELTALLCYNDLVAVGVLQACVERGIRVPQDLAVVGFDDIPLAALVTPPLTTCRVPRHELGMKAVELLLERIRGDAAEPTETDVVIQPELVVRASAP
jgi:LacI family transcriptional regulator